MNITEAHLEIAKERFLELMAQNSNPTGAALTAIEEADAFVTMYKAINVVSDAPAKVKGCPSCYGSGGKGKSCRTCFGTGKVVADQPA